jgi:hypothetical protein
MFGLGLNNNGTGLVLASVALAHLPGVMLTVILYTLVQHVIAGMVSLLNRSAATDVDKCRKDQADEPAPALAAPLPVPVTGPAVPAVWAAGLRIISPYGKYPSAAESAR